jgi:hypothetical protein
VTVTDFISPSLPLPPSVCLFVLGRRPPASLEEISCGFFTEVMNGMFATEFGGRRPKENDAAVCAAAIDHVAKNVLGAYAISSVRRERERLRD